MSLFDTIKQAVGDLTRKKGKDVNLPNEAPVTEGRVREHRERAAKDVSSRFKKVADNVMQMRIRELRNKGLDEAEAIRRAHKGE